MDAGLANRSLMREHLSHAVAPRRGNPVHPAA
jgi:hypothetical protein